MAQPVLDFLEGRAKQALPYLRGAADRNLTPSEAIDILKPLNLTFNRQRMLDVYAAIKNEASAERVIRLVGPNTPIPEELHTVAPTDLSTRFQYLVGAFDETGEPLGYVTISSNITLSGAAIREAAIVLFEDQPSIYLENENITPTAISIDKAYTSLGPPTL